LECRRQIETSITRQS